MALVRLVEIEELSGEAREVAESGFKQYGKVLNTWKAIFNRPNLFAAYLPFLRQVAGPGALNQNLKDLCALYVGLLNHCRYTASHRATSGLNNGLAEEQLQNLSSGNWDSFDEATRVALAFTKQLTLNSTSVDYEVLPQAVEANVLSEVKRLFTDEEIVDLAMTVSVWNSISRFHRVMNFELDMPKAPEGVEPK
jgi:alkylhydroperoxidase family enzyme